jgi:hypothetical protein
MNIAEGARRMRRGGLVLFLVCLLTGYLSLWLNPLTNGIASFWMAFAIVLPGVFLWLAGWILGGFAIPNRKVQSFDDSPAAADEP